MSTKIYEICCGDEKYIGQTIRKHLYQRLSEHKYNCKVGRYGIVSKVPAKEWKINLITTVDKEFACYAENYYINKLKPKLNSKIPTEYDVQCYCGAYVLPYELPRHRKNKCHRDYERRRGKQKYKVNEFISCSGETRLEMLKDA